MVRRLATYFDEARVGGWVRLGAELDMKVVLGRAVLSGKVDRIEGTPDGTGLRVVDYKTGSSKPRGEELDRHPQLGAYQLGVESGAFGELGDRSAGAALLQVGKAALVKTTLQTQAPAARRRGPAVGGRPRDRAPPRGWPARPSRRPSATGARCARSGLLPRAARGAGALMARDLLSAKEIAAALGQPEPTAQQIAVIEAPMSPLLVVAGAGSGKTETMTGRVVWLVANGFVEPDQVLGLTFTRKAATELSERIGARLRLLQQRDVWHPAARRRRDRRRGARRHADRLDLPLVCRAAGARARAAAGLRVRVAAAVRGGGVAVRLRGGRGLRRADGRRASSPSRP